MNEGGEADGTALDIIGNKASTMLRNGAVRCGTVRLKVLIKSTVWNYGAIFLPNVRYGMK